jgi:hypothetical protein
VSHGTWSACRFDVPEAAPQFGDDRPCRTRGAGQLIGRVAGRAGSAEHRKPDDADDACAPFAPRAGHA